eukprot:4670275-Amphidinium_carterae.2
MDRLDMQTRSWNQNARRQTRQRHDALARKLRHPCIAVGAQRCLKIMHHGAGVCPSAFPLQVRNVQRHSGKFHCPAASKRGRRPRAGTDVQQVLQLVETLCELC